VIINVGEKEDNAHTVPPERLEHPERPGTP